MGRAQQPELRDRAEWGQRDSARRLGSVGSREMHGPVEVVNRSVRCPETYLDRASRAATPDHPVKPARGGDAKGKP